MNEDIAERIAAGAPASVRESFLRAVIPGLGQALLQVRENPARIKRCNARQARRVVALVNDPETLTLIAAHEQRVSVRDALRSNPAWQRTPHELVCAHCQAMPTLPLDNIYLIRAAVSPRDVRIAAFGASEICPELIMRTLRLLDPAVAVELWQSAFANVLGYSAQAYVELAAGRTPLAPASVPDWGGRNQPHMRRLLEDEPAHTSALLDLAIGAGTVPSHWEVCLEEWCDVLKTHDAVALAGKHRIPFPAIVRAWDTLSSRARIVALGHAQSCAELELILETLTVDDIIEARSKDHLARELLAVLHRFPSLDSSSRLGLVSMLPRREVGEYLLGRLGSVPDPDQIEDILALYNLGQRQISYRTLIEQAGRNETAGEHRLTRRALIEALVGTARPAELFSGENRVSQAAHAYTWERLEGENAIMAFAGLLEEWTGNLPDLIETARELGR